MGTTTTAAPRHTAYFMVYGQEKHTREQIAEARVRQYNKHHQVLRNSDQKHDDLQWQCDGSVPSRFGLSRVDRAVGAATRAPLRRGTKRRIQGGHLQDSGIVPARGVLLRRRHETAGTDFLPGR